MPLAASRTGVWLAGSLLALFLFRLWFAAALPLTGDEAYFVVWGGSPPAAITTILRWLAGGWLRCCSWGAPVVAAPAGRAGALLLAWGAWWLLRGEGGG